MDGEVAQQCIGLAALVEAQGSGSLTHTMASVSGILLLATVGTRHSGCVCICADKILIHSSLKAQVLSFFRLSGHPEEVFLVRDYSS